MLSDMTAHKVAVISGDSLTIAEAARELDKSERSIERLVAAGKLDSRIETSSGRRVRRITAASLERFREAQALLRADPPPTDSHVVPTRNVGPGGSDSRRTEVALAVPDALSSFFERIMKLQEFAAKVNAETAAERAAQEKLWLTIDEAAAYSGIAQSCLRELIAAGQIEALRIGAHRAWRIRRVSLEAFQG